MYDLLKNKCLKINTRKIIVIISITIIIFCNFTFKFNLIDYNGISSIQGYGFPFVWYENDIAASLSCVININRLIIDFILYFVIIYFLISIKYFSKLRNNIAMIFLIAIALLVLILFFVNFVNPSFYPLNYKVDYFSIKLKLGFWYNLRG